MQENVNIRGRDYEVLYEKPAGGMGGEEGVSIQIRTGGSTATVIGGRYDTVIDELSTDWPYRG